jgi:hypothetical protein
LLGAFGRMAMPLFCSLMSTGPMSKLCVFYVFVGSRRSRWPHLQKRAYAKRAILWQRRGEMCDIVSDRGGMVADAGLRRPRSLSPARPESRLCKVAMSHSWLPSGGQPCFAVVWKWYLINAGTAFTTCTHGGAHGPPHVVSRTVPSTQLASCIRSP